MADIFVKNGAVPARLDAQAYTVGQVVAIDRADTSNNQAKGWVYECTGAGTTGSFTAFPATPVPGTSFADGSVTWTTRMPDSWARALPYLEYATITNGSMQANDTCYVSVNHVETNALAAVSHLPFAGTRFLCVLEASPPTTLAVGASVTGTAKAITVGGGTAYYYGIYFSVTGSVNLTVGGASGSPTLDKCRGSLGTGNLVTFGTITTNKCLRLVDFDLVLGGGSIATNTGKVQWDGGGVTGTAASTLFSAVSAALPSGHIQGVDFSALPSSQVFFPANNGAAGNALLGDMALKNCKLPAGWSGSLLAAGATVLGARLTMDNCDSGDTNYRMQSEDATGVTRSETTLVKTGGATDGTTPMAWKMVSSVKPFYPTDHLVSRDISFWNDTAGSPITVTADVLTDSLTALTNADVGLYVEYPQTAGFPLGSTVNSLKTQLAAPTALTASAAVWTTTGMTNPQTRKISLTFTPTKKGVVTARVRLYKASTTIYVDPLLTVT